MRPVEEPKPPGRRGMTGYAKAGAYMGLAFITPIAGYIGYVVGLWLAPKVGVSWLDMAGLMLGCASGMYETYRQALRIEGLDRKR
jgi:hypothetical protein